MKFDRHLFDWPSRHNVHLALPAMLVVSFLLHAASAVVFQVTYPRPRPSPEHPARVFFLRPGSPDAVQVEPVLAAEDPALFSPAAVSGRGVWKVDGTEYVASFDAMTTALSPAPPAPGTSLPPVSPNPGPVTARLAVRPPGPVVPGLPTTVRLGGGLDDREATLPKTVEYSAPVRQRLTPAEFLVAVSPDGRPLHVFPQRSSGHESLDRIALRTLLATRFSRKDTPAEPAWGTVTFLWGNDIRSDKEP